MNDATNPSDALDDALESFKMVEEKETPPPLPELLTGLRNLSASRIAVLVDTERATEWQENDFFALALQRRARFSQDGQSLTLYSYDLAEYKSVPDWLNSKYWANPEMFDKYWW